MFEIIILACLINSPAQCKDFHYEMAGNGQVPMQCMMEAQKRVIENLPRGYKVEKFGCRKANREEAKI